MFWHDRSSWNLKVNEPTRHTLKTSRKSGCGTSTRQAERSLAITALCTHELCLSQWGFFTSYPEMCIFLQTFPMYGLLCGADFGLCCGLSAKVGSNNQKEPDPRHRRSRCESNDHNSRIIEMLSAGPTMRRLPALVLRQVAPHSALRQGLGHN